MRRPTITGAGALLLLATVAHAHKGAHEHLNALHRRHRENRLAQRTNESIEEHGFELAKRGGQCAFPTDAGLVAVTPGSANAGWAMSPDQPCQPGSYCPYACPPGQVSVQWDPKATTYSYPQSMVSATEHGPSPEANKLQNGGLYCDSNGQISKPFPDKPYCQSTASNIGVVNNCGGPVSFCQTVLPGNEAMLIPTEVSSYASLAVPGTDYWAGTAAHYYINPPGTSAGTACVWGSNSNPWGNWSPYVAGANQDASGETFIKLGWNPIYLETATPFRNTMPDWGVKIDCPNGGCNGLPCAIDPSSNKVNGMQGGASSGAGGGNFCVVTVSKGSTANFVVYSSGGNSKGGQFYQSSAAASSSSAAASSTAPSSSSAVTTTSAQPTTTKATTTTVDSSSDETTSQNSTMTEQSSTTNSIWSSSNTTTSRSGPTGPAYYSLFNTAAASPTDGAGAGATATGPSDAASTNAHPIASSTGGASRLSMSLLACMPIAFWSLI